MKTYCALESCPNHTVKTDAVGFVDFPAEPAALRPWLALTWVRHVVRGVTRLCTDHFALDELEPDPGWEAAYPGEVNPNPRVLPGVLPTYGVPGWIDQSEVEALLQPPAEPPSMFVRQEGSSARRVRPTERLREAHELLFDGSLPLPLTAQVRRGPGRPPRRGRGRPPGVRRPPSPPPDLSDPEVRARLVQQAMDEYDYRERRAAEQGHVREPDGTETVYVTLAPDGEERPLTAGRGRGRGRPRGSRGMRGRGVKRFRAADGAPEERRESEPAPPQPRLPPNTSPQFREVLAAQRELQALQKRLEALPAPPPEEAEPGDAGGALVVLRGDAAPPANPLPEGDHFTKPGNLQLALVLIHQQRLENLRLRAELLRAAIRERERAAQLAAARREAADAANHLGGRLGEIFTPAQLSVIQNKTLRRAHMWDTVDVKRAIGLRQLCTRRAYAYVRDVLGVPLPGLAVLRGSSQRDPETARMYARMVESHRLKHMTKRAKPARAHPVVGALTLADPIDDEEPKPELELQEAEAAVAAAGQAGAVDVLHGDHKYIVFTDGDAKGRVLADPAAAADLLETVQAAGQEAMFVDESGAPLYVDRAAGGSPAETDHYLVLMADEEVPEGVGQVVASVPAPAAAEQAAEVAEQAAEQVAAVKPQQEPGGRQRRRARGGSRPGILRKRLQVLPRAGQARLKVAVKEGGEALLPTELGQIDWAPGMQWMNAAQGNFEDEPPA